MPSKSIGTVKTKCSVGCGVRTFTNMIKSCINSSGIKSRECVVSVISITSVFRILHSMITQTTQDEDERADFERNVSNLDAKRKEVVN